MNEFLSFFSLCILLVSMADQLWFDVEIKTLLQAYNDRYTSIDKGNFCLSDWQFVLDEVCMKRRPGKEPKTKAQVKNKIDSLKKKYRHERDGARQTCGTPSKWPLFDDLDQIFGSTPKTRGIPGACDAGVSTEEDNLPVGEDIPDFSTDGMQLITELAKIALGWVQWGRFSPIILQGGRVLCG